MLLGGTIHCYCPESCPSSIKNKRPLIGLGETDGLLHYGLKNGIKIARRASD
jgi:hypothetical protein